MATRNLARTVVERGRAKWFREMERWGTRAERQAARQVLSRVHSIDDALEADSIEPRWADWEDGFNDSLAVAERFLQANAGRLWDDVYSELCRKYDRNTTKGRHLIDLHITSHMVEMPENDHRWMYRAHYSGAWVDERGILQYTQRKRWW